MGAVYNSPANALMVFGGNDITGAILGDVWVLSNANGLGGTPTWTQVTVPADPGPRNSLLAAYNEASDRMTIFGGLQTVPISFPLNDTWVLEGAVGATLNAAPVADAGADQTVECTSHTGTPVTLDGSASSDPDDDTLTYTWTDVGDNVVGTDAAINLSLPLGTHTFTLTVDDGNGGTASDTVSITVQDTTQPSLTLATDSITVLVPTHSATSAIVDVLVASGAVASDICDPNPVITNDGPADSFFPIGTTVVTLTATDGSGNFSQATFTVHVVYNFIGFLPPLHNDGSSLFKSGRVVPVKFQLTATDGTFVSAATATLAVFKITDDVLGSIEVEPAGESNEDNFFRYDFGTNQYIYNLSTKGYTTGTYLLRVTLNDATQHDIVVSVR